MDFPVELIRDQRVNGLVLKISSLNIFGGKPVIVPESEMSKLGFFSLTYEGHYTIQAIQSELARLNRNNANAFRNIRTKRFTLEKPYREMITTTFQSYQIPEELAEREREKSVELASYCTS